MVEQILIVRVAALGDIVMASALLSRIRAERPGARVTWMCGRGFAEVVGLFGVDATIEIDERAILGSSGAKRLTAIAKHTLRTAGLRFDRVIVAHPDRRYRVLAASIRGRQHYYMEGRPGLPRSIVLGRFWGDEFARLLDGGEGAPIPRAYDVVDVRGKLPREIIGEGTAPRVVLVPGGARNVVREVPLRRWPVERYAELARRLRGSGFRVALVGDKHDDWVRPHMPLDLVEDYIGRLSITQTLTVMRDSELVITHDTGPLHLARLVRARLIGLFGPSMPTQCMPGSEATEAIWGGEHLACRPCWNGKELPACTNNLCMQSISVDTVFDRALARAGSLATVHA